MDAKCERVHFSVHNMITKLVGDKHKRWPDLLGTVALAYNATVHYTTGYLPHELFYSFAPSCPLDAMVITLVLKPTGNADEYALHALDRLQEAASFIHELMGKQMQQMKHYYNTSVEDQQFEEGEQVLVYDPKKRRGRFAKWQVLCPVLVERCLNDTNYVL